MTSTRLQQLLSMLEESPGDAFLFFALAQEYDKTGFPDKALAYYLKLREVDPDYVGLYYHLGKWHERNNDQESAMAVYRDGIEVARQQGDSHASNELRAALEGLEDW